MSYELQSALAITFAAALFYCAWSLWASRNESPNKGQYHLDMLSNEWWDCEFPETSEDGQWKAF